MKESGAKEVAQTFQLFLERISRDRERANADLIDGNVRTLCCSCRLIGVASSIIQSLKDLFNQYGVDHYSTTANEGKAFMAEQKLREIKRLIRRYYELGLVKPKGKSKANDWAQLVGQLETDI